MAVRYAHWLLLCLSGKILGIECPMKRVGWQFLCCRRLVSTLHALSSAESAAFSSQLIKKESLIKCKKLRNHFMQIEKKIASFFCTLNIHHLIYAREHKKYYIAIPPGLSDE